MMNDRLTDYLHSLQPDDVPWLEAIRQKALAEDVPVVRRETAGFLKTLITLKKPERILEVGTAVGYSALIMAQVIPESSHITTIEKYEPRIVQARENFNTYGLGRITLLEGDAAEILAALSPSYDFIFMDAAKGQYIHFLPDIQRLLAPGGVLVSDNVLQEGRMLDSRLEVTRRDRTIHSRMREYLYELMHDEGLISSVLNLGDGLCISVKKEQ